MVLNRKEKKCNLLGEGRGNIMELERGSDVVGILGRPDWNWKRVQWIPSENFQKKKANQDTKLSQ